MVKLGFKIDLPPLSQKLLEVLLASKNQFVSSELLKEQVWEDTVVADDALKQRIFLLRQALETAGITHIDIISVRGKGYCLTEKTKPSKIIGMVIVGLLLITSLFKWVISPMVVSESMVNNRLVFWNLNALEEMPTEYSQLVQQWRNQITSSQVVMLIKSDFEPDKPIPVQARSIRAGLVITWQLSTSNQSIVMQVIEPKSSVVLSELILPANPEQLNEQRLAFEREKIERAITSEFLPLTPEALKDTNNPAWQSLRQILNQDYADKSSIE